MRRVHVVLNWNIHFSSQRMPSLVEKVDILRSRSSFDARLSQDKVYMNDAIEIKCLQGKWWSRLNASVPH